MKVKPLLWRKLESGENYVSEVPWRCDYWINKPLQGYGEGMFAASFSDYAREPWRYLSATLDEAKAACQAHHENQIAKLLESPPNVPN